MDSLEIREAYLDLRTAIFERERADWQGQRSGFGALMEDDIIPCKKEIKKFIASDWFRIYANSSEPIEQVRKRHLASLGPFRKNKKLTAKQFDKLQGMC